MSFDTSSNVVSWRAVLTDIGLASPTCPHCGHSFEKMPQRKRACPKCNGVFYSRKRATDGAKVLLTEAQALEGEGQDALVALVQENGTNDADVDALVHALQAQLGRLPIADEVVAQFLQRAAAEHAESWRWGLYRNARFNLAESCARRGLREDALRLFLEVHLLDLNGPRNIGSRNPELVRRFPPFDPATAFLAPGVVTRTADVMSALGLSLDDARSVFESVAASVGTALAMPRSASNAWRELSRVLAEALA